MDRHQLWRNVANNFRHLEQQAPEGHEPYVLVFLTGRAEPVEIGFVQTSRADDNPWTLFRSRTESESETLPPDLRVIFAHEALVERVEISFQRKGGAHPVGFSHSVVSRDA